MSYVVFESKLSEDVVGFLINEKEDFFSYISPFCNLYIEKYNIPSAFRTSHLFHLNKPMVSHVREIHSIENIMGSFFLDVLNYDNHDFDKGDHDAFISLIEMIFAEFKYGDRVSKLERVYYIFLRNCYFSDEKLRSIFLFLFELMFKHYPESRYHIVTECSLYLELSHGIR